MGVMCTFPNDDMDVQCVGYICVLIVDIFVMGNYLLLSLVSINIIFYHTVYIEDIRNDDCLLLLYDCCYCYGCLYHGEEGCL